jgi:hypothetical protein
MLGENGTEQFTITVKQDGKLIREQKLHDPFLWNSTTIALSRWDLFKALFRKQFVTTVEVKVDGTQGVVRAVMMLDPERLQAETEKILADRARNRESNSGETHGFIAEAAQE